MAKYSNFIELSPNYESVVDLDSEERNPNLWQEYIVHEDMKVAIEKICESLRNEYKDARRSFWIHGAYGTGKSYAAIVLKHLFEDNQENIHTFMSKQLLMPYRNKFEAIREEGDFLVVWKSGCTGIHTGTQLMMEMEICIRQKLNEKFGNKANYGRNSLIAAVQNRLNDASINWQNIFSDPTYGLYEENGTFQEFANKVMQSELDACDKAAKICRDKGWALFATVDMFEAWLKDVIECNRLSKTGIVFIWDEFTTFVRECGDDNVLQRLAEYCKQQPFFMFLIVHIEASWVATLGEETYKRILNRYHELEFHISESAAYDLIGNSILTRTGMDAQWNEIKDNLMKSISKNMADFDALQLGNQCDRLRQLCPIHPMTLSLLATVAQNFGASQRTLFRFMKDRTEAQQQVGFIHYIDNYGPDDWRWLTPDFLWDYFFTRESDIKGEFSSEARRAYQHYLTKKDIAAEDKYALHVFKAAILLIAVMSTEKISHLRSQSASRKLPASKRTLYKCFVGQLPENDIDQYLVVFEENGMLRLDSQSNGDARLELPYTGNVEIFDVRLEQTKKKYTRYELLKKGSVFSKTIEEKVWDRNRATANRVQVVACSAETNSLSLRLQELVDDLNKNVYRIGILVVVIREASQYALIQPKLKEMAAADKTGRLIICLGKEPLTDELLDRWHRAITHKELAAEEGKKGSSDEREAEADMLVEQWARPAIEAQLSAFYKDIQYSALYGCDELMRYLETDIIFKIFPAAPERLVTQNPVFKKGQEKAATYAITKEDAPAPYNYLITALKANQSWDAATIAELEQCTSTQGAYVVSTLAKYIHEQLSHGAKIKLDVLWIELQKPPFGYYDTIACSYLLGYVLRFYKDGEFNWVDNSNNPFPLSEKNIATMVYKICRGDVVNHTLSSGSEIWQQFRPYAQKLFKLTEGECVNEQQARKYMKERIITSGTPLWVIQYLPEEKFGGNDAKAVACNVVTALGNFITEQGNQEDIMSEVITLFKGRGQIRQAICEILGDNSVRHIAFRKFVLDNQPKLKELIDAIGLAPNELFDAIKFLMQGYIYTWTEEQVIGKLEELTLEYQLIDTLNMALGVKRKTVKQIKDDLNNCFENMKVPGSVIETLNDEWIPALKTMRLVSEDGWSRLDIAKKENFVSTLANGYGKQAWEHITESKLVLAKYLSSQTISCTESEIDGIYTEIKPLPYNTPASSFKAVIQMFIERIAYERNKQELLMIWQERSGEKTIFAWCKHYTTPIQWVVDDSALVHILLIKSINDGNRVDVIALKRALEFFEQNTYIKLKNTDEIQKCFFSQIGTENMTGFREYQNDILARIRMKLGSDIYSWGNKAGDVRNIVEKFIKEKNVEKFKSMVEEQVMKMPVTDLRSRILKLLDNHPEYSELFLDSER
jgi:hypothetical protein